MSRRNSRLLLDTSFLLPVLGFETSRRVMRALPSLARYELYYNEISLLEALWKIVKILRDKPPNDIERVVEGVQAIIDTMTNAPLTSDTIRQAIYMYMMGHRDMIDNILYSIALTHDLVLLTVDNDLIRFVHEHNLSKKHIITPEEL